MVPASVLATVPIPLGFWKAPSAASSGPSDQPSNYSNLQVWYRSSDLSLNDGDAVSTWTDRSSNANNATNTGTARPIFKTNIIGSTPVLRFDFLDDNLALASTLAYGINATFTLMVLAQRIGDTTANIAGSVSGIYFLIGNNKVYYYDTVANDASDAFAGTLTDFRLITVRKDVSNVIYRENKTARGTHNIGTQGFQIAKLGGSANSFNGDFVEFVAWNQVLTDGQCDSLYDNYFKFYYPSLP